MASYDASEIVATWERQDAERARQGWPEPTPLPDGLKPVKSFDFDFLPSRIVPWLGDIAERMQCPPDFVAIPALVALGSAIGRKIGIRPQSRTNWIEVPNLWGCIVGRPGAMKSPAMNEVLKPLQRLQLEADADFETALAASDHAKAAYKIRLHDAQDRFKTALKRGVDAVLETIEPPPMPVAHRYIVNDTTYEALGEVLAANPNGTLAYRDELVSLLRTLDREDNAAARGFFLSAWDGKSGYTFDRVVRGKIKIDAACLSLLGSSQPGRIAEYIRRAVSGGAGDDGLIQRFGLLVWPDQDPDWKEYDRYPNSEAREIAASIFTYLAELTPDSVKAEIDPFGDVPFLRFDEAGRDLFAERHRDLELRLRSGTLHAALESHLSKYRKLIPALALINHLAVGNVGPVNEVATLRAVAMSQYLESHAVRLYAAGTQAETSAANAILAHIRRCTMPLPPCPLRECVDTMGMLAMPDEDTVWNYQKAVERYEADGDRAALMRALLSVAVAPEHIHWHLAQPGRRVCCMYWANGAAKMVLPARLTKI